MNLLVTANRATHDAARVVLEAKPDPETRQDARERIGAIVDYLERGRADDYDAAQAESQP